MIFLKNNRFDKMSRSYKQLLISFLFEAFGTAFLTVIVNIQSIGSLSIVGAKDRGANSVNFAMAMFAVSFVCWDVAPA